MAPGMLAKQVNTNVSKDSLLDKSVKHSKETLREFVKMVDNKGKAFKPVISKLFYTFFLEDLPQTMNFDLHKNQSYFFFWYEMIKLSNYTTELQLSFKTISIGLIVLTQKLELWV